MPKYFKAIDSRSVIEIGDYTFKFEPAYRNMATGGSYGVLVVEDAEAAAVLEKEARSHGVFVIDENEYTVALQKKSTLNINLINHGSANNQSAQRVEVKKGGQTSSAPSAESFDELMAGPKEEPAKEAQDAVEDVLPEKPTDDTEEEPEALVANVSAPEEAPKKKMGRPKKAN
jgi:predicted N-formylglutamate amidohydrolase